MRASGHCDVAEALEATHAQALQLVLLLSASRADPALLLAHALMDNIDSLRALHVRVVMQSNAE